jgi:hypothetical protein
MSCDGPAAALDPVDSPESQLYYLAYKWSRQLNHWTSSHLSVASAGRQRRIAFGGRWWTTSRAVRFRAPPNCIGPSASPSAAANGHPAVRSPPRGSQSAEGSGGTSSSAHVACYVHMVPPPGRTRHRGLPGRQIPRLPPSDARSAAAQQHERRIARDCLVNPKPTTPYRFDRSTTQKGQR